MNYDFTRQEIALFADVTKTVKEFTADGKMDCRKNALDKKSLQPILRTLSKTSYLKLGLEPEEGLNGHLSLMGAMEVLAAASPSAYLAVEASTRLFGRAVCQWANPDQKERLLSPLLAGERIGALALSEAGVSVENQPFTTSGHKEGSSVVITGKKQYVINAPCADWIAVAGLYDESMALFFIEKNTPGLVVSPPHETMGYEGALIAAISLEDCQIPESQIVLPSAGPNTPAVIRMWENQIILGASLGISSAAFDTARDFAKSHKSGSKPVIAYQEIGFKLAEMLTLLQTSQLLAYRTAWTLETNPGEARELMWCAKVFCTESAEQICSQALQVMGAAGCVEGNRAQTAYRCAKYNQVTGTSTEIARVKIGDAELGYRE
ncbi:MAG: acyl-CoA dehydrogenase family protein [Desulfobacterales bacterium]|nr:acyl-CoA dehydrogenase family protein [Desulfobacterales bacterium]